MRRWSWLLFACGVVVVLGSSLFAQEKSGFPDVPKSHWAFAAVSDLKARGILQGYPKSTGNEERTVQRDAAVLEAVLVDLMTYKGKNAPVEQNKGFEFNTAIMSWYQGREFDAVITGGQHGPPPKREERTSVLQALRACEQRGQRVLSNARFSFTPTHPQITLWKEPPKGAERNIEDLENFMKRRYQRPVSATLPGYTKNGQIALVRLSIPWSIHHADGIYVLKRNNGKWLVKYRYFVYYV